MVVAYVYTDSMRCKFCGDPTDVKIYCSLKCERYENQLQWLLRKKSGKLKYPRSKDKSDK